MPSTRYTVRLPLALDALVQEWIRTSGTPFAVLIHDALSASLADTPPPGPRTPAASAATLHELQAQLAALITRVEALEQRRSPLLAERRPLADRSVDRTPTRTDTLQVHTRGGQRKLTPPWEGAVGEARTWDAHHGAHGRVRPV